MTDIGTLEYLIKFTDRMILRCIAKRLRYEREITDILDEERYLSTWPQSVYIERLL